MATFRGHGSVLSPRRRQKCRQNRGGGEARWGTGRAKEWSHWAEEDIDFVYVGTVWMVNQEWLIMVDSG